MYRLLSVLGILSLVIVWTGIVLAIVVSGCFSLNMHALSDLGDWVAACEGDRVCMESCNRLSEPIFNYGVIISGILFTIASIGLGIRRGSYTWILL